MPITGHFEGDFAKFSTAVEGAQASLKNFESDGAKVETRLTNMGNALSGVKIVQQATLAAEAVSRLGEAGGVSAGILKLTDSELQRVGASAEQAAQKLRALGQDVPTGIQAIADAAKAARTESEGMASSFAAWGAGMIANVASGQIVADVLEHIAGAALTAAKALPDMVTHAMEVGNSLYEMSLKTGASVENLSRLRYVASQTGIDFESFSTTFQKMEQNLGAVGTKADALQGHLNDLHLKLRALRDEKPDEAFLDIVSALEKIPNPAERAADGVAIFGRGWKEMSGLAVENIRELMEEADRLGLTVTTMSASAAHAAETGFKTLGMQLESIQMRIGNAFMPALVGLTRDVGVVLTDALTKANGKLDDMGKGGGFLATVAQAMGTGSNAVAAQVQLYEQLRDGIISFVRNAVEPAVKAFAFLMTEFDASKVLTLSAANGIQAITYEVERFLLASIRVKQITDPLNAKGYEAEAASITKDIDRLYNSMANNQVKIDGLKKSETDWGSSGSAAIKEIEAALTKFGATHADVEGIIAHFAKTSKDAYGGASTAVEGASKKEQDAAAALAAALIPLTSMEKGRADYLLSMGLREEQAALLMGKNVIQIHNYVEAGKEADAVTKMWKQTFVEWHAQAGKAVEETVNKIDAANAKEADSYAHQNTVTMGLMRDFHDRVAAMNLTGTEAVLANIDRQQAATNAAFDKEHDKTTWYYLQARSEADAYYAHLRDLANHSTATIEQEMAAKGVYSKNQLETQATNERLIYNAMVQDGGYTTQQLEAQWKKFTDAKIAYDNGWAANSMHVFSELEDGFNALAGSSNTAFASVMKDLATFMQGLQDAQQAGQDMAAAYANDDIAGMASAAMKGAAALDKVTSSGSTAERALKGAATGFEMGNAIVPGWGGVIGAAAGAIVGFVKAANAGRKAVEDFATAQGGFDTLHAKLDALPTGQGEELWKELTQGTAKGDPKAAQAAIDKITKALAAGDAATKQFDTDAGGVFQKIAALGGNVDASMLPYLNDLATANKLSTDNIALLGKMSGDGKPTYQQLDALAQKYNLTMDQMGSGFQGAKIHDEFQSLIDDMDELQRGGVDLGAVLTKVGADGTVALSDLGTQVQNVITQSAKYGQDVPENMKPAAQALIDQGLLLDANGNKITDINQIKFGESMQTSLETLNLTLKTLIDTLTGNGPNSVKSALDTIGKTTVSPTIKPKLDTSGLPAGTDTTPANGGAQADGGDYYVTKPTVFLAGEAGPESVSFGGANNKRYGSSSATAGPIHIHVMMPDGRTLAEVVVPHIPVVVQEFGLTR